MYGAFISAEFVKFMLSPTKEFKTLKTSYAYTSEYHADLKIIIFMLMNSKFQALPLSSASITVFYLCCTSVCEMQHEIFAGKLRYVLFFGLSFVTSWSCGFFLVPPFGSMRLMELNFGC